MVHKSPITRPHSPGRPNRYLCWGFLSSSETKRLQGLDYVQIVAGYGLASVFDTDFMKSVGSSLPSSGFAQKDVQDSSSDTG